MNKLLSGRFYLTVVAGFVFAYCSLKGMFEGKDIMIVVLLIFNWYFQRERSNGK